MKMFLLILMVLFLIGIAPVNSIESDSNIGNLVATYDEGKLYQYGSVYVVELHGNYREMGRQYGALRKDVLNEMYGRISNKSNFNTYKFLSPYLDQNDPGAEISGPKKLYSPYSNYNEMILGVSETSGLGDKIYLIASPIKELVSLVEIIQGQGCSYDASWGPYNSNSSLIAGRNMDLGRKMGNYTEIVVYNPDDGSIPVATAGFAGSIYMESGLNKNGLFMEMNEATYSQMILKEKSGDTIRNLYGGKSSIHRISDNKTKNFICPQLEIFRLLQNSSNMSELDKNFANENNPITLGLIINAADKQGSYSYEWMPYRYVKRNPQDNGLLVATNHYLDPSWGLNEPEPGSSEDVGDTVLRMNNIINLSKSNRGNITPEIMMQIMGTPLDKGGPLVPQMGYQVVVVPEDLKMWVRSPQYFNWTAVDLKKHFSQINW